MFEILLEAALGGYEIVNWHGKRAVVMGRSGGNIFLLVDGGPKKPVVDLNKDVRDKHVPPDIIAAEWTSRGSQSDFERGEEGEDIKRYGSFKTLKAAEVLGRPGLWYQKAPEPPSFMARVGREPGPDYQMKRIHKGDVDIRVKFLDSGETKILRRDVRSSVPLLTVVSAAHFDATMKGKTPPTQKAFIEPEQERERQKKYKFDSKTGEFIPVPVEKPEAEPEIVVPDVVPEEPPESAAPKRRKMSPEEEEEYKQLRKELKQSYDEPEETMSQKIVSDLGKSVEQITTNDLRAYIDGAPNSRERGKRMDRVNLVRKLKGEEQEGMKED
ncbi:MAG: hypothetical protein Q8K86_08870 [Candidatus Nanopelagicaceae bacterium]|nr:hypothetical protein [Candidatus Nanopelagicaceae bacterium]